MALHRRSFLKLAGIAGTGSAFGICAPAIVRAATPIKLTLPWLPLGTYSFTFAAKKLGYWEKRGLDVTIDRGFGSTKVCVPVDQGQYDFGLLDMAVQDATIEKKPEICKAFVERRCQAQRKSERWTKINIAQLQLEQAYHLN